MSDLASDNFLKVLCFFLKKRLFKRIMQWVFLFCTEVFVMLALNIHVIFFLKLFSFSYNRYAPNDSGRDRYILVNSTLLPKYFWLPTKFFLHKSCQLQYISFSKISRMKLKFEDMALRARKTIFHFNYCFFSAFSFIPFVLLFSNLL